VIVVIKILSKFVKLTKTESENQKTNQTNNCIEPIPLRAVKKNPKNHGKDS